MAILKQLVKSKFFLLYVLAIINILVSYFYLKFPFVRGAGDSVSYYNAMNFLKGAPFTLPIPFNRLLTVPLMLFMTIFFNYFIGDLYWSMAVINIIFYFLIIYFFYKIVLEIYNDEKVAVLSSVLFLSNYAMFTFGTTFLTDMGGWFFFILSTFFAIKYYKSSLTEKKFYFVSVLAASIGFLFKEYGGLGLISLSLLIFFTHLQWREKIRQVFVAGLIFFATAGLYHFWFYLHYHYSYIDWYAFAYRYYVQYAPIPSQINYSFAIMVKVLGWLYLAGWPIFLLGLWQEKKNFDKYRAKILGALLPASLMFFIWPAFTQRLAFIFVPWLALISGFGLSKIKNNYIIAAVLLIYILINYNIHKLITIINLPF